jgi:hypothetical protein
MGPEAIEERARSVYIALTLLIARGSSHGTDRGNRICRSAPHRRRDVADARHVEKRLGQRHKTGLQLERPKEALGQLRAEPIDLLADDTEQRPVPLVYRTPRHRGRIGASPLGFLKGERRGASFSFCKGRGLLGVDQCKARFWPRLARIDKPTRERLILACS